MKCQSCGIDMEVSECPVCGAMICDKCSWDEKGCDLCRGEN